MLDYILQSGAFGTLKNSINKRVAKYGGGRTEKLRYLVARIFRKPKEVSYSYPFLCGHMVSYPALVVYRLFKALLKKRRELSREILTLWDLSSDADQKA